MVIAPNCPAGTGTGNSPPARKLAVSPDNATRLGSARLRARPFCSSALIETSSEFLPPTNWPTRNPNGATPESTPAATAGEIVELVELTFRPPVLTPGCWNDPPAVVIG